MKAMILAAGLGTRMRPLTLQTPKPLLKINAMPLIEYHIRRLAKAGIKEIVINHAWLGEQIEQYLGDGDQFGVHISYSRESQPLETAGGIRKALELLTADNEDQFIVINGDIFTNYPFEKLLQPRVQSNHIVLVKNPLHNQGGDFYLAGDQVNCDQGDKYTFSGISVLSAQMFAGLDYEKPEPLAPLLRYAIANGDVGGELFQGYWMDVGTPKRLAEIDQLVREQKVDGL